MTNPSPQPDQRQPASAAPRRQRRQVSVPGARPAQRRGGLLLLGLVLVFGSGFGFWLVLQSIDQRAGYLAAARTIERWEVVGPGDFAVVEANVGAASALTADQVAAVAGRWATGRIPAGTLITAGLFDTPPLSGPDETDRMLIQVSLPSSEAPFGTLEAGDTVALLGSETLGPAGEAGPLSLISVLQLDFVQDDNIFYIVPPDEALDIMSSVDRFMAASDRRLVKLGYELSVDELVAALAQQTNTVLAVPAGTLLDEAEQGSGAEPVGSR